MIDRVDKHRRAEGVGQKNEFLTRIAAFLADGGQESDRLSPFFKGRLDLADERVQMTDERVGHLANPRRPGVLNSSRTAPVIVVSSKLRMGLGASSIAGSHQNSGTGTRSPVLAASAPKALR